MTQSSIPVYVTILFVALSLSACSPMADSPTGGAATDGSSTGTPPTGTDTTSAGSAGSPSAQALCDYLAGQVEPLTAIGSKVGAMANLAGNLFAWYDQRGLVPDGGQIDQLTTTTCSQTRAQILDLAGVKSFAEL